MSGNLNNVSPCGQGLSLIASQPHNSSGEFNLTPVPSESTTIDNTNVFVNYYMAHLINALEPESVYVRHYTNECNDYCFLCNCHHSVRRNFREKGIGFLLDGSDSEDFRVRDLSTLMFGLLGMLASYNAPDLLTVFHHLNMSLYYATEFDEFVYFAIWRTIGQYRNFLVSRSGPFNGLSCGLKGGVKRKQERKKEQAEGETDKKYRKRTRKDKEKKPLVKLVDKPKEEVVYVGSDASDGSCSIELVSDQSTSQSEGKQTGSESSVKSDSSNKPVSEEGKPPRPAPKKRDFKPRNSNASGTRASGRNNAIARSVMDQSSKDAGERDALKEQIKELKEEISECKEVEVEVDLNTAITEHGTRISTYTTVPFDINKIVLSARPACNVGVQLEPLLLGGVNVTIPVLFLFIFLMLLELILVVIAGYVCFGWLNIWLTLFYSVILSLFVFFTLKYFIYLVRYLAGGKPTYTKLYTTAEDTGEYFEYSTVDRNGKIMDLRPSEIKIGASTTAQMIATAKLSGPIRAVTMSPNALNFNEPVKTPPRVRLFGVFEALDIDGDYAFVDREGNISPWRGYIYSLLHICFSNKRVSYITGSYTGKEFAKPANSRKLDSYAYSMDEVILQYDLHTYHNANTYSANSSQISEETNYSILYRKISRYTEINQSRFARKDLLTNAETLCRLSYFSIREAYPNFLSRQHF